MSLSARAAREFEDFSVAKRELPLALIFGSIAADYIGPGFSIGFVGRGFKSGFLFLAVGLAYAVQNIFVGLLVAPKLRQLKDCYTLGDAIGQKYDRKCQILAGVISVALCTSFSAVMISAGSVVLDDIFGLPRWLSVSVIAVVTASYTTFGGLRASVVTDAFHFVLFALLLPVTLLYALLFHFQGGAASFFQQAFAATADGFSSTPTIQIIGFVAAFLLGETLIPPYANLALASRDNQGLAQRLYPRRYFQHSVVHRDGSDRNCCQDCCCQRYQAKLRASKFYGINNAPRRVCPLVGGAGFDSAIEP